MLLQFLTVSALLTLLPGPDIIFLTAQSLRYGRRVALSVALGLSNGLLIHTAAVAAGIAIWVAKWPELFSLLRYAGAGYLAYLGVRSVMAAYARRVAPEESAVTDDSAAIQNRSFAGQGTTNENTEKNTEKNTAKNTAKSPEVPTLWRMYRQGITMNLLNPKVVLFFLSFFPGFVPVDSVNPQLDIIIMGGLFSLQALVIFSAVGLLAGVIGNKLNISRQSGTSKIVAWCSGVLYLGIGVMIVMN